MLVCTLITYAVPADNITITHTQKDGTVLTLRLVGDEHMHYYLNVATGKAMRQDADGDFVVISDEELSANREYASQRRSAANARRRSRMLGPAKVGTMGTMTGQKKGIVILVNFADKTMTTGTQAKFNNMFNQQGYSQDGHIGSVADYFKAQSYGQFELSFDVVGPVTLSQNMAYYGGNNSNGNDLRPGQMAREACVLADGLGVDFSKYDWTSNGSVDQVFVIYAGYGENYSGADENTIWPHEWDLSSATGSNLTLDGKTISTYACCAELYGTRGTTLNGMGTACHEFSHCLGYPDTYDIDYSGGVGMDSYDIMCGGSYNGPNKRGEVPAGFTAYERWMAGWLEPRELSSAANVTDMKDLGTKGEAYVIYNNSNKNEYFLLENRQSKDWFRYYDSNTAGHGLFITHVDFNQTVWNNNAPNDDPNHQRMTWVPADKNYGTYSSSSWSVSSSQQKGDYFPGTSNVKSFKPTASAWNTTGGKWFTSENGSYYTTHELSEITENTTAGTISFLFDGGIIDDGSRYTITLDACGGSVSQNKWTQTSYKEAWTLPEPVPTVNGWYGGGWSLTKVSNNTPFDDVDLIDYDRPYEPESDITLYAVYINNDYNCNSYPITPDPERGDGGDEPGEGEGDDITITPISGIPAGYYNSTIVGKNDRTLELALKAIINPHTAISYSSLWKAYETTDVVPTTLLKDHSKTDQVYDMYTDINTFTKYYSDNDHTQTGGINREHCVPNSWWGGKEGNATAYTDLHHLVPSDGAANNAKSNHPLGEYQSGMTLSWPTETKTNTNGYTYVQADNTGDHSGSWSHVWNTTSGTKIFEPADEFKGDFARMYLYVVCAYEGDLTWQTADNTMFSNNASDHNYTVIADDAKALLLKWHRQDPVSDKERLRNNAVHSIQGNRNPFIDYPILAEYIWGNATTETTFSLETMPSSYQFGVTYRVGTDVTCSESVRLCDRGSAITLPTATTTVDGWNFCGWTTSSFANTTTAPTPLLTGSYTPTENVDLYAVFQAGGTYSITPETLAPETPDTPGTTTLYFPHIAHLGQPFTAPAFNTNSDGAQTWTSSNPAVATVDNEGHVTIHAVGTTIITVTQAETANYKQGTASYMIKVVE